MSDLHPTALELSYRPLSGFDPLADVGGSQSMTLLEPPAPRQYARLDEPSSLTLALVGVVTLASFRGFRKRVMGRGDSKGADHNLIKPRRRAA